MRADRPVSLIEQAIDRRRAAGGRALAIYVTGGLPDWELFAHAAVAGGADVIEVGIPFSDPVMDGPVIQEASERALRAGATPASVLDQTARAGLGVPLAVMTYYNLVFRFGNRRFAASLAEAGISGAILPDLPLVESAPWCAAADDFRIDTIMLAAPTSTDEHLDRITARSRGFVYAVGLLGVTGERSELAASAVELAQRVRPRTERPVLVGVGVSTPAHAVALGAVADGVVVGSAVVRCILETGDPESVRRLVAEFRDALDESFGPHVG